MDTNSSFLMDMKRGFYDGCEAVSVALVDGCEVGYLPMDSKLGDADGFE